MAAPQFAVIDVAIVIVWREGRLLARLRLPHEHLPGVWEFPGGKVHADEAPGDAAARELREEMGLIVAGLTHVDTIEHTYDDRGVRLIVFEGSAEGDPETPDGAAWAWLSPAELASRPIPHANRALVERLVARERAP